MSTSPFLSSPHSAGGYQPPDTSIPARRPLRKFVPAPVLSPVTPAPPTTAVVDSEQLSKADAVLALLRSVNGERIQ